MKKKPAKTVKPRNTLLKRLAMLTAPNERLNEILANPEPKKHIREDAASFVKSLDGIAILKTHGHLLRLTSEEVEAMHKECSDRIHVALFAAHEKMDANFFEHIALYMRHMESLPPKDFALAKLELEKHITGKASPTEIAEQLTANNPNANPESEKRRLFRYQKLTRRTDI